MGLLNDVKKADAQVTPAAKGTDVKVNDKAEKKAKAKERKAAKREALVKILDYVKTLKDVPAEISDAVKVVTVKASSGSPAFGPSKLVLIFGAETPKAGTKVTAMQVFEKAGMGYPEMKKYMKKWAEKGINIELDTATASYIVK